MAGASFIENSTDFALVRYNSDGSLDITFDHDGKVTTDLGDSDYGRAVAIQSNGQIVVAGNSSNDSGSDFALARYNGDGSLDTTFGIGGKTTTDFSSGYDYGRTVAIQSDGKIIVGGSHSSATNSDFALVRYNSDGSLDTTFDTDGKVITDLSSYSDNGYAVIIQPDRKILLAGETYNSGSNSDFALVRYQDTTFADVPASHWAWAWIERLFEAGITGDCATNPFQYCPEANVTRAQMAVLLERGMHGASYIPPAAGDSTGFNDVPTSHWAAAWIKQLAIEGITSGCGSSNYCPDNPVTRAQIAVVLLKAKYGSSYLPASVGSSTGFSDVPTNFWAAAWIKQLAAEGITGGCGSGVYCPEASVTRAQMAVLLVRTFSLP